RISDARMSGTSYGTCVLHVAPESAVGGPLALVRDGDLVRLDVPGRRLDLLVPDDELTARRRAWQPPAPAPERGHGALFARHVTQADQGCDFDFLGGSGAPEPVIHGSSGAWAGGRRCRPASRRRGCGAPGSSWRSGRGRTTSPSCPPSAYGSSGCPAPVSPARPSWTGRRPTTGRGVVNPTLPRRG